MVNFMRRVPVGTFIIPMLISAVIFTFWPDFFSNIGGVTDELLGGKGNSFIIGLITFVSGIGVDVASLGKLFKRHGIILIFKFVFVIALGFAFMSLFGHEGILGVSSLAFVVALMGANPSLYISLVEDYGDDLDPAAFGLTALFAIPALPMLVFGLGGGASVDWMPIISAIIPMVLGIILGNLDPDFRDLFANGVPLLIPVLGWNIGMSLNLIEGLQSGLAGIVLAILYYVFMAPTYVLDKSILKNDGIASLSMMSITATSASFPMIIAQSFPELQVYVNDATAQIVTAAIITIIVTPILVTRKAEKQADK